MAAATYQLAFGVTLFALFENSTRALLVGSEDAILNAQDGEDDMEMGLYVAVSDLSKARSFYSELFSTDPYIENDNFVGFEMSGGRFGVMKEAAYAYPMTRGNNVVPNIRVSDAVAEFERVKGIGPSMIQDAITDLGAMKLFMFADPDGNVIEFHSMEELGA